MSSPPTRPNAGSKGAGPSQGSGAPQHAVPRPCSRDVTLAFGRHDRAVREREHPAKPACRIRQGATPAAASLERGDHLAQQHVRAGALHRLDRVGEPVGRSRHIVVHEGDIASSCRGNASVPSVGNVGPRFVQVSHEVRPVAPCPMDEVARVGGRAVVHDHDLVCEGSAVVLLHARPHRQHQTLGPIQRADHDAHVDRWARNRGDGQAGRRLRRGPSRRDRRGLGSAGLRLWVSPQRSAPLRRRGPTRA